MKARLAGEQEMVIGHVLRLPGEVFEAPAGEVRRLTADGVALVEVEDGAEEIPFTDPTPAGEESDATEKGTAVTSANARGRKART